MTGRKILFTYKRPSIVGEIACMKCRNSKCTKNNLISFLSFHGVVLRQGCNYMSIFYLKMEAVCFYKKVERLYFSICVDGDKNQSLHHEVSCVHKYPYLSKF